MKSIQNTLLEYGFDPSEAEIYLILQQNGEMDVPAILHKTEMSRASVYDSLSYLLSKEIIDYRKDGRRAFYKPGHPDKLYGLVEQKKRENTLIQQEMEQTIGDLTGMYNLSQNKPGVRFFEGKEGVIQAYEKILDLRQPILSIEDRGDMMDFFPEYVAKYVKKRIDRQISNRSIAPDTNKINQPDKAKFIDSRLIPAHDFPFSMDIKICGDTIQMATLKKEQAMAVHISNPIIAENFKVMFEYMWKQASEQSHYKKTQNQAANSGSSTTVFSN
ncbi:MAG: helix-turn-helix domain-containing protein [bacterium]